MLSPIDLEFARTDLIDQIRKNSQWSVDFERAEVAWAWSSLGPSIRVSNLFAQAPDRAVSVRFSNAQVGLPLRAFLGHFDITSFDVNGIEVFVSSEVRQNLLSPARPDVDDLIKEETNDNAMARYMRPPSKEFKPLAETALKLATDLRQTYRTLKDIRVTNALVTVDHADAQKMISARLPRLNMRQSIDGIRGSAQVDLLIDTRRTGFTFEAAVLPSEQRVTVQANIEELRPDLLQEPYELPAVLKMLQVPTAARLTVELTPQQGLTDARFILNLGAGRLYDPVKYPNPAPISFGEIAGRYLPSRERLDLEAISLDLNGRAVTGAGTLQWNEQFERPAVDLSARIEAVSIGEILTYWPVARELDGREKGGRAWVARNLIGGIAGNADFRISVDHQGKGPFLDDSPFELTFDYWDLETYFISSMPPIMGAFGNGRLTATALDLSLSKGTILGVSAQDSRILLDNIHRGPEGAGYIHLNLNGPVRDVMEVLDYRPVRLSSKIKVDLDRFHGTANVQGDIAVPLGKAVSQSDVVYDVFGSVSNFGFDDLLGGEGLREGELAIELTNHEAIFEGTSKVNGIPVDLKWVENLELAQQDLTAKTTDLTATSRTSVESLEAIGLSTLSRWGSGPFRGTVRLKGRAASFETATVSADLTDADLMVPELGWEGSDDHQAKLDGTIRLEPGVTTLDPIRLTGKDIDASLKGQVGTGGNGPLNLDAVVRRLGENSLRAAIKRTDDGLFNIKADASRLDIRPFLGPGDPVDPNNPPAEEETVDMDIEAKARTVLLLNGETLGDVSITTVFRDGEPKSVSAAGRASGSNTELKLEIEPMVGVSNAELPQSFSITSGDAGFFMRGMGFFSHLQGGALKIDGSTAGFGRSLQLDIEGRMTDSWAVQKAQLSDQVTVGVLEGLDSYIGENGIEVARGVAPITFKDGLLDFGGLRANGPNIGITLEGQIKTSSNQVNINGVVVPAYTINAFLGKIPIIGPIFSGGKGEGLFAVPYRVRGDINDPEVIVSAASTLAPGFLRTIISGKKGKVSDLPEAAEPKIALPEKPGAIAAEVAADQADQEKKPAKEPPDSKEKR